MSGGPPPVNVLPLPKASLSFAQVAQGSSQSGFVIRKIERDGRDAKNLVRFIVPSSNSGGGGSGAGSSGSKVSSPAPPSDGAVASSNPASPSSSSSLRTCHIPQPSGTSDPLLTQAGSSDDAAMPNALSDSALVAPSTRSAVLLPTSPAGIAETKDPDSAASSPSGATVGASATTTLLDDSRLAQLLAQARAQGAIEAREHFAERELQNKLVRQHLWRHLVDNLARSMDEISFFLCQVPFLRFGRLCLCSYPLFRGCVCLADVFNLSSDMTTFLKKETR